VSRAASGQRADPERRVLADTSVFIGLENGRFDRAAALWADMRVGMSVSVVTIAELRLGVLTAQTVEARGKRLTTLRFAESLLPLPVDDAVANAWAMLTARLREGGRKIPVNDCWIAATAIARDITIATQDTDYDAMPGVSVIRL
jgi:predicted nucleic acid-binding protein